MADDKAAGSTPPGESFEAAMQRAREINEQIMEMARKAGHQMLDGYVRWLEEVAEQQRKIASGAPVSQVDWLAGMLNAQADFTRQFAKSLREFPGQGAK
jgi:hypothetical protein